MWRKRPMSGGQQLGQVTRDTEELDTSVLSPRALTEQFRRLRRKQGNHIGYILASLFSPVRSVSSDCRQPVQCLPVMLSITYQETAWSPQSHSGEIWPLLISLALLARNLNKKNITTVHLWGLFPIQAIRLPDAEAIMGTAHNVCCHELQSTCSNIHFCICTMWIHNLSIHEQCIIELKAASKWKSAIWYVGTHHFGISCQMQCVNWSGAKAVYTLKGHWCVFAWSQQKSIFPL